MTVEETASGSNTFKPEDAIKNADIKFDPSVDSIWAAASWYQGLGDKSVITKGRAGQCTSSLISLWRACDLGDSPTVNDFVDELGKGLIDIWCNRNPSKAQKTARDYRTKAEAIVIEFQQRCKDGSNWDRRRIMKKAKTDTPSTPGTKPTKVPKSANNTRCSSSKGDINIGLPCEPSELTAEDVSILVCHLATKMPAFTVKDAGVIASHLATRGSDFDPTQPVTAQLF